MAAGHNMNWAVMVGASMTSKWIQGAAGCPGCSL